MADTKKNRAGEQQPVDEKQRYAEMSTAELKERQTIELNENKRPIAYGFANKERKNTKHHVRHAMEMGFKNQDEYERAAVEFFNGNIGKLYYGKQRERFYRYEDKTHRIAVCDVDGIIRTFDYRTPKEFEKMKNQEKLYET